MADRDLRTAFKHLQEDVMNNVQTEQRLDQIVGRRTRVSPRLVAFAGATAVVLLIGAALLALRPGDPTATVPPATGSTLPPTTIVDTTAPPTTTDPLETTTTVPAVSLPALEPGLTVIARPVGGDFSAEPIDDLTVLVNAERAVGDGGTGLFIEAGDVVYWARPEFPLVELFSIDDFVGDELWLEDSAAVDGVTHVVVVVAGGVEEQSYEEVWIYDPDSAASTRLFRTGAYEGGIRRASLQNDVLAVTRHAEGFSWFEFFDAAGEPITVNNPRPDDAEFPVFVDQGVLSPDGTTMVYIEGDSPAPPEDGNWRVDLIVWNLADGVEESRIEVELGNWYVDRMDFDGTGVVLGRTQWDGEQWVTGPALRIAALVPAGGPVSEFAAPGIPSLIK